MTRFLARSFTILALSMVSSSVFAAGDIDCRLYGAKAEISYFPHLPTGGGAIHSTYIPSETVSKKFNLRLIKATTQTECINLAKQVATKAFSEDGSRYNSAFVSHSIRVTHVTVSFIGAPTSRVTYDTAIGRYYWPMPSKDPSQKLPNAVSGRGGRNSGY